MQGLDFVYFYKTYCHGLDVENHTQALKSVKGPGNTFL
jgi:hypothetical protein